MAQKLINTNTLSEIAENIRKKRLISSRIKGADFAKEIARIRLGLPISVCGGEIEPWKNDLLSLPLNDSTVYLTVDDSSSDSFISIRCDTSPATTVKWEIGHIENGAFVADETVTTNSGQTFQKRFAKLSSYPILKVTSANEITRFSQEDYVYGGRTFQGSSNFFIERVARIRNYGSAWTNVRVRKERTIFTGQINLSSTWNGCLSLQILDLSGWDTRNWSVTNIYNTWNNCYSLQFLDLSGWDTSNWSVANFSSAWNNCCSLQSLDLSGWDTSNWKVNTLAYTWSSCLSLQYLDIRGWDTSNWSVTNLTSAWNSCLSLRSLDLSGWNTSNWAVTTLQNAWYNCYSLQSLDLSGWNTSNWAVTTLQNAWYNCYSLQHLNLSGWNTSNWAVTTCQNAWNNCFSLYKPTISPLFSAVKTAGMTFQLNANNIIEVDTMVRLFNEMPTISVSRTLQLGAGNLNKLTADEKAIATSKGWTLA